MALSLDVRLDGFDAPAGQLHRDDRAALTFTYTAEHVAKANAYPISMALPLTDEPYRDQAARAFFDNLLQERDGVLTEVMAREGLARDDVAGLLLHLGKDCPGALSVLPENSPPVKVPGDFAQDYVPMGDERFATIATALHERKRLPDGVNDPSPLAGVQSKLAITLLPDGRFAEPRPGSGAPTTHIIKVPDKGHLNDAKLEAAAMELSLSIGFETAEARVMRAGNLDVLVVTRFDRSHDDQGRVIRVHQEDFAQALGLPASLKYERRGTPDRKFDASGIAKVLNRTVEPAKARESFLRATLFDLMTGNVDAHAKNHALLYRPTGAIDLAPRYDLLPTRLDPNLTDELPFKLGNAKTLEEVTTAEFDAFLGMLGITSDAARRRVRLKHASEIAIALASLLENLGRNGMKAFADLIAANMRTLLPALDVAVPDGAQHRDAFINRGGGWLNS